MAGLPYIMEEGSRQQVWIAVAMFEQGTEDTQGVRLLGARQLAEKVPKGRSEQLIRTGEILRIRAVK